LLRHVNQLLVAWAMRKFFLLITYVGFRSALADLYEFFAKAELVRPGRIPRGL